MKREKMMKKEMVGEQNIGRQIGCMAGFLHIFDRHHILVGKRLPSSTPPLTGSHSSPESSSESVTQSPTPLPVLELKQGKFSRETPTLSLDAKAGLEKQRRSTSVVARLMGLEDPLPDSEPELRTSPSQSRDLSRYCFFELKQLQHPNNASNDRASDPKAKTETEGPLRARRMGRNKCFYDSGDFFPEPKQSVSMYGEIERRLKMRGIDEPSMDLHTLKQILEALQLKGLLHSNKSIPPTTSPIVVMKPNRNGRNGSDSPPPSRLDGNGKAPSPMRSPNRIRNTMNAEQSPRKVAPVPSVKVNSRRNAPDQQVTSRSPRIRKTTYHKEEKMGVVENVSSTVSESSFTTSSQIQTQRFKKEEHREGRKLLQRCDKLLNSIVEIAVATTESQPSPVSVLDSSFYKDESSCSPSPVMKRCIDYKDLAADSEDDVWNAALCCNEAKWEDREDFVYVSEIVRACNYFPEGSNVFLLLEKQQYLKGNDISKACRLRRRLIFDTIQEILYRKRRLPPWKAVSWTDDNADWIWSEFRRIRERKEESEEVLEVICGVLRKDMAEDAMNEWGEFPVEMGDMVLDTERLLFKDLIGETIRDLASFREPQSKRISPIRRKLVL